MVDTKRHDAEAHDDSRVRARAGRAVEVTLGQAARRNEDTLTGLLLDAQLIDSERCRRFTTALIKFALESDTHNAAVIRAWIEKWNPLGEAAIAKFCAGLPEGDELGNCAFDDYRESQRVCGASSVYA